MMVAVADTAVNKDTMVVSFRDAITACTAVLGPSRFCLPTGFACMTWNKKVVIIRIEAAMYIEVFFQYIAWVHCSCEVKEDIWTEYDESDQHVHF